MGKRNRAVPAEGNGGAFPQHGPAGRCDKDQRRGGRAGGRDHVWKSVPGLERGRKTEGHSRRRTKQPVLRGRKDHKGDESQ